MILNCVWVQVCTSHFSGVFSVPSCSLSLTNHMSVVLHALLFPKKHSSSFYNVNFLKQAFIRGTYGMNTSNLRPIPCLNPQYELSMLLQCHTHMVKQQCFVYIVFQTFFFFFFFEQSILRCPSLWQWKHFHFPFLSEFPFLDFNLDFVPFPLKSLFSVRSLIFKPHWTSSYWSCNLWSSFIFSIVVTSSNVTLVLQKIIASLNYSNDFEKAFSKRIARSSSSRTTSMLRRSSRIFLNTSMWDSINLSSKIWDE